MEQPVYKDQNIRPTDEIVKKTIGEYGIFWDKIFDHIRHSYPDVEISWNYYNDGKSWLLKTVRKKKTLFWTTVFEDSFNVTFYFGDKAADMIETSTIASELKEQYKNGKRYGKIRAISMKVLSGSDVENAIKLAELKNKLK